MSLFTSEDNMSTVTLFVSCQRLFLLTFFKYTGLTELLLQKQLTDYDEVIEKLFSEVPGLEAMPKIPDPQVDKNMPTCLTIRHKSVVM